MTPGTAEEMAEQPRAVLDMEKEIAAKFWGASPTIDMPGGWIVGWNAVAIYVLTLVAEAKFFPIDDNHHNAAACPYCSPPSAAATPPPTALRAELIKVAAHAIYAGPADETGCPLVSSEDAKRCAPFILTALIDALTKHGLRIVPEKATGMQIDAMRANYSGLFTEITARRLYCAAIIAAGWPIEPVALLPVGEG